MSPLSCCTSCRFRLASLGRRERANDGMRRQVVLRPALQARDRNATHVVRTQLNERARTLRQCRAHPRLGAAAQHDRVARTARGRMRPLARKLLCCQRISRSFQVDTLEAAERHYLSVYPQQRKGRATIVTRRKIYVTEPDLRRLCQCRRHGTRPGRRFQSAPHRIDRRTAAGGNRGLRRDSRTTW